MNISNNNEISLFIVENKMQEVKELLENSNKAENCDLESFLLKFVKNFLIFFLNRIEKNKRQF